LQMCLCVFNFLSVSLC